MSRFNSRSEECGFSLAEVVVAIFILNVGLLGAAALAGKMSKGSDRSKYMGAAAVLASEKLEDLNRWDVDDPQICVQTADASEGSLTVDKLQTTTCGAGSASVNYYDDVNMSLSGGTSCPDTTAGCFAETVSSAQGGGTVYTTTTHSPNGIVQSTTSGTAPGGTTFHRRWIIEKDSPVTGLRRVTVLVTLLSPWITPPLNFQMSIARP